MTPEQINRTTDAEAPWRAILVKDAPWPRGRLAGLIWRAMDEGATLGDLADMSEREARRTANWGPSVIALIVDMLRLAKAGDLPKKRGPTLGDLADG